MTFRKFITSLNAMELTALPFLMGLFMYVSLKLFPGSEVRDTELVLATFAFSALVSLFLIRMAQYVRDRHAK